MSYLVPIKAALIIFPFLALLITLPYIIYEYHHYGSVNKLRTLIIYSFILYLMTIYFLVILPLPTKEEVIKMKVINPQLIPLTFIKDIVEDLIELKQINILKIITIPSIYTVIFNIIMFMPLGVYLRYYYKCSLKKTIIISLLISLFFELTQLTGLYYIYPRPYRNFDVDDLLINPRRPPSVFNNKSYSKIFTSKRRYRYQIIKRRTKSIFLKKNNTLSRRYLYLSTNDNVSINFNK